MKLAIIGAAGHLGSAVAREAAARGHQVTPLSRDTADITDPGSVAKAVGGHDAVVAAVSGPDRVVPRGAHALLQALPPAGVLRLVFLGGGGSLEYAPGRRFTDSPDFPVQYRQAARDQAEALGIFRTADTTVQWTYASPPPVHLIPGAKTGTYRTEARDTPLTGPDGESRITTGDYASAIIDVLEDSSYIRQRFTAAN